MGRANGSHEGRSACRSAHVGAMGVVHGMHGLSEAVSNSRPDGVAASFHHFPKAWSLGGKGEATHGTFLGPGLSTWTTS